jgi:hypothetical protein
MTRTDPVPPPEQPTPARDLLYTLATNAARSNREAIVPPTLIYDALREAPPALAEARAAVEQECQRRGHLTAKDLHEMQESARAAERRAAGERIVQRTYVDRREDDLIEVSDALDAVATDTPEEPER